MAHQHQMMNMVVIHTLLLNDKEYS